MSQTINFGSVRALRIAQTGVGFRIPEEWCAANQIALGDTVYVSGKMTGEVVVSKTESEWSKPVKIRVKDRKYAIMTIPADIARTRGIEPKDDLDLSADVDTMMLTIRKGVSRGRS